MKNGALLFYGHGTTISKKQQKPRGSVDSGVGSENIVELPQKKCISYQKMLKNYVFEG